MKNKEIVLKYNHLYKPIRSFSSVVVNELCNSWSVINIGTTVAVVNSVPLNPGTPGTNNGESISYNGNKGEIFYGRIDVSFPVGNVGEVILIQKIYLPDQPLDV